MENILEYITNAEHTVITVYKELSGRITHIYSTLGVYMFEIVYPHSGNGFSYMLRADATATHDRWSVSDYEEHFKTPLELIFALNDKKYELL